MQVTRQRILEILKERGQATIDELGDALDLTPVTIRHHLDILRGEGLVEVPEVRRRTTPGRPQYVYILTETASDFFPKNYSNFANLMIEEIRERYEPAELDHILRGMAKRMTSDMPSMIRPYPMSPTISPKNMGKKIYIFQLKLEKQQWLINEQMIFMSN